MRANWQVVRRGDVQPQYAGIYVTMNTKGVITMSRVTYKRMGEPTAFTILFDTINNRIGLKPSRTANRNAYPALVSNKTGAKSIRAWRLISEYRIDLPHTVRFYDADFDDQGTLILDLRTAKPCPRAAARNNRPNSKP